MKRTIFPIVALCLFSLLTITGYSQGPVSMNNVQNPVKAETMVNPSRADWNVLVIRDVLPWGWDVTVPILLDLGATVSTATSVTFPGLDFSLFDKIVVESYQSPSLYASFEANLAKFETYVINGGLLEINACTPADVSFNLPGGAISSFDFSGDGYHALPGHPFLAGVPDPFFGNFASHNSIINLPAGAQVITRNIPQNTPTLVTYTMGSGTVIATGLTLEIAYYYEDNGWGVFNFGLAMYPNILGYTVEPPVVPITNWALIIGIVLIGTLAIVRFRKLV